MKQNRDEKKHRQEVLLHVDHEKLMNDIHKLQILDYQGKLDHIGHARKAELLDRWNKVRAARAAAGLPAIDLPSVDLEAVQKQMAREKKQGMSVNDIGNEIETDAEALRALRELPPVPKGLPPPRQVIIHLLMQNKYPPGYDEATGDAIQPPLPKGDRNETTSESIAFVPPPPPVFVPPPPPALPLLGSFTPILAPPAMMDNGLGDKRVVSSPKHSIVEESSFSKTKKPALSGLVAYSDEEEEESSHSAPLSTTVPSTSAVVSSAPVIHVTPKTMTDGTVAKSAPQRFDKKAQVVGIVPTSVIMKRKGYHKPANIDY